MLQLVERPDERTYPLACTCIVIAMQSLDETLSCPMIISYVCQESLVSFVYATSDS